MALSLTSVELARVRDTQNVLLAPLGHADPAAWAAAAAGAVRTLIRAEHATMLSGGLPAEILFSTLPEAARTAYIEHFAGRDLATPRALLRGLSVAHLLDVVAPDEYYGSELHHDYAVPYGLHDAMLLRAETEPGCSMWVATQQARPLAPADIERCRVLLELVLPAFAAGVRAFVRWNAQGRELLRLVDALPTPLLVCNGDGQVLHENGALARLLGGDPGAGRVRRAMAALAASLAASLRRGGCGGRGSGGGPGGDDGQVTVAAATIRTAAGRYAASGTVAEGGLDTRPLVLIQLARDVPAPALRPPAALVAERLREQFGLTARETQVATLLADRLTNREIADALRISEHTAERHTERVLHKLGVTSRTKVRERISGGRAGPGPDRGTGAAPLAGRR
jgi:DNA-binding CsgD family transcriptional regulator/PAS domain-containing protein